MKQLQAALVAVNLGSSVSADLQKKLGGSLVIDANSLPGTSWTPLHGQASDGTVVNSPRVIEVGETTILQDEEQVQTIGMATSAFEVACAQYLKGVRGYKVTPPQK
ncbi:MAG: hypothetical protein Q8Q36_01900 [bacterium]|nr:hypothetical protein [bacterium]